MGKSNNDIAKEVVAGKWGNGSERRKRLEKAGYNYDVIQKLVNKILTGGNNQNNDFKTVFNNCINAIEKLPEFKELGKWL